MRIVIKIGTSTLAYGTGMLNIRLTEELCKIISDIKNSGAEIILVSSGAIGLGVGKLGLKEKPKDIPGKQAAAAVGQCELMAVYDKYFQEYSHTVAQVLLTADDFNHEDRYQNFINTINTLLDFRAIPIINENDTVATSEIKVGDNDTLSALVAKSINADLLIILSDIDGLYDKDPHKYANAKLIKVVEKVTDEIIALGGDEGSSLGTGGMKTKLTAARMLTESGTSMCIANGSDPNNIYKIVSGKGAGTLFKSVK